MKDDFKRALVIGGLALFLVAASAGGYYLWRFGPPLVLFNGETLDLEQLRGKYVMIDFWASWCPPCRQEAQVLAGTYERYKGRGIEFVGISIWDSESGAGQYIRQFGITYPNGPDPKGRIAIDYGVTGIPEKYFISPDGVVLKKFIGPMDQERLDQVLDELLRQGSSGTGTAGIGNKPSG